VFTAASLCTVPVQNIKNPAATELSQLLDNT